MKALTACVCGLLLVLAACSRSNNLFLGRVETTLGTHKVVVTDCYRTSVPPPERTANGDYHYMPCRDADIWIRGLELTVNGRSYGRIGILDSVLVDHGLVSVERRGPQPVTDPPSRAPNPIRPAASKRHGERPLARHSCPV